ncbi:MAG: hypothetical protein KF820_05585 [Candidatus Paracaedibacteraceae bacterium]|nr:hypothetical protein [Candidatus Paracaedibacteraceae bacterium]
MNQLQRILILPILAYGLSSCGFSPMYCGDRSQTQAICLTVKGDGFFAYKFRRELEKQLAILPRLNNQEYKLAITLSETKAAATYAEDASITRSQITVHASYQLRHMDRAIGEFKNEVTTSYPVVATDEFITRNADQAAITRAAIALAEDVARDVNRLLRTDGKNP